MSADPDPRRRLAVGLSLCLGLLSQPARAELCDDSEAQCPEGEKVVATTVRCPIVVEEAKKVPGSDTFSAVGATKSTVQANTLIVECEQKISCELTKVAPNPNGGDPVCLKPDTSYLCGCPEEYAGVSVTGQETETFTVSVKLTWGMTPNIQAICQSYGTKFRTGNDFCEGALGEDYYENSVNTFGCTTTKGPGPDPAPDPTPPEEAAVDAETAGSW